MSTLRRAARPVGAIALDLGALLVLRLLAGAPLDRIRGGLAGVDDYAALAALTGLALLLGWVLVVLIVGALARVPGALGAGATAVAALVTPVAARRAVQLAVGASVVVGPVAVPLIGAADPAASSAVRSPAVTSPAATSPAATSPAVTSPRMASRAVPSPSGPAPGATAAASAEPASRTPAAVASVEVGRHVTTASPGEGSAVAADLALDRPGTALPTASATASTAGGAPATPGWTPRPWPGPTRPPHVPRHPAHVRSVVSVPREVEAVTDEVVVRRGDCLWSIAARHLGPDATDAEIALEWPRWYAANRDAVGEDPDVILPGTVLRPPQAPAVS